MAKVKNISPLGDLYVSAIDTVIAEGETIEVSDELAASLLEMPFNFESGDGKKTTQPVASTDIQEEK